MKTDWKDMLSSLRDSLDEPLAEEKIQEEEVPLKQKDSLLVSIDKKGRKGKTATLIEGFSLPQEEIEAIARNIKQKLGVGGSVRDGEILIQGNYLEKVKIILKELNFKIK